MSDVKSTGGPAFPVIPPVTEQGRSFSGYPYPDQGMTLRQWYAGQVMPGVLSTMAAPVGGRSKSHFGEHLCDAVEEVVDAMIARFA